MIHEALDLLAALFFLVGALLCLAAAVALVRFPDVLAKMHAITKPQVLGLICVATGIALDQRSWWATGLCTLIVALQLLTSPVSANLVARSAYRSGVIDESTLKVNQLAEDLEKAGYQRPGR